LVGVPDRRGLLRNAVRCKPALGASARAWQTLLSTRALPAPHVERRAPSTGKGSPARGSCAGMRWLPSSRPARSGLFAHGALYCRVLLRSISSRALAIRSRTRVGLLWNASACWPRSWCSASHAGVSCGRLHPARDPAGELPCRGGPGPFDRVGCQFARHSCRRAAASKCWRLSARSSASIARAPPVRPASPECFGQRLHERCATAFGGMAALGFRAPPGDLGAPLTFGISAAVRGPRMVGVARAV